MTKKEENKPTKIKQEIIDVVHEHGTKYGCSRGVKKYHIRNGTFRENEEFKRLKKLLNVKIKTIFKGEIHVK